MMEGRPTLGCSVCECQPERNGVMILIAAYILYKIYGISR